MRGRVLKVLPLTGPDLFHDGPRGSAINMCTQRQRRRTLLNFVRRSPAASLGRYQAEERGRGRKWCAPERSKKAVESTWTPRDDSGGNIIRGVAARALIPMLARGRVGGSSAIRFADVLVRPTLADGSWGLGFAFSMFASFFFASAAWRRLSRCIASAHALCLDAVCTYISRDYLRIQSALNMLEKSIRRSANLQPGGHDESGGVCLGSTAVGARFSSLESGRSGKLSEGRSAGPWRRDRLR